MSKSRDPHRRHQQLMQQLHILNIRIRGHEQHMKKVKGKLSPHEWESLVRELKSLTERKSELSRKIKEL